MGDMNEEMEGKRSRLVEGRMIVKTKMCKIFTSVS